MPFTNQKIPTSHARKLAQNYKRFKLDKKLKKDDTQGVWFDRRILMEALGVEDSDPNSDISGLRFYMGAYEEDQSYPRQRQHKGKLTLVFVQTTPLTGITGEVILDEFNRPIQKDILDDSTAKPECIKTFDVAEYNDGQICPPPHCDQEGLLDPRYIDQG